MPHARSRTSLTPQQRYNVFSSGSHDFTEKEGIWYNSISTANDKVVTVGTLFYRAVAIDTKGVSTTSLSGSLSVKRCDTEASISGGLNGTLYNGIYYFYPVCPDGGPFIIKWRYLLSDKDGLTGATITYSLFHTGLTTYTRTVTVTHPKGSIYWIASAAIPQSYDGDGRLGWSITTTDQYATKSSGDEGRSSQTGKANVSLDGCID